MKNRFFNDGFDYKKYIQESLLNIENHDERSQVRDAVFDMLIPFYEHIEDSYRQIEQRLFESENEHERSFQIVTGIEAREKIDLTDTSMFPMCMEDMQKHEIPVEELLRHLNSKEEYMIYSVFVRADYSKIKELERNKRTFKAVIKTGYGEYPATVRLRKNTKYVMMLKELYTQFVNNGIEWKTVLAPYLNKIFDVIVVSAQCNENEKIEEIAVYFEEYEALVKYNYVPLWNIRTVEMKTSAYPSFCLDRIHYEHCIYGNKLNPHNDYLITNNIHLWNVCRRNNDIYIQCNESAVFNWKIREFCYGKNIKEYDLPLMKNGGMNQKKYIRTIAEAKRYAEDLNCSGYIKLKDINMNVHNLPDETYDCDVFVLDEIRKDGVAPALYFEFTAVDPDSFLTRDIMSYAVSRLQLIYPEYKCKGILV